jgi:hypothetical protein
VFSASFDLSLAWPGGGVISHGCGHDQTITFVEMLLNSLKHLGGTVNADKIYSHRRLQIRSTDKHYVMAGLMRCVSQGIAHFAAACVGNETDRVNVFACAACCD